MSIFSSIDSQSLYITRKLLEKHASSLCNALPEQSQSRYSIDEVTLELEMETINNIIRTLTQIGELWLADDENTCQDERKTILSYLLKQWIQVGEEAYRLSSTTPNIIH